MASSILDDLARRDLSINAMAWHPSRGLLDMYNGASDLSQGLVRAVGVARTLVRGRRPSNAEGRSVRLPSRFCHGGSDRVGSFRVRASS